MNSAIAAIAQLTGEAQASAGSAATAAPGADFGKWLDRAVSNVDQDVAAANSAVQNLALGQADGLHGGMLALENARESVALMLQVRNRLVDAYQDILRMQI